MSVHFRTLDMCGGAWQYACEFSYAEGCGTDLDNCACGGTDKGPSIHSISGLSGPTPRWQQSLLLDGSG